ncbi:unnamed protein product [Prunus armeniaca]|uniref:Uncharacterized protein n=1 Tax=Prunus armeniaca TaxID=36596 RepID=A0A6J5X9K0_PRUAR|nr:unnamed protein product [Prunus armeniaca]
MSDQGMCFEHINLLKFTWRYCRTQGGFCSLTTGRQHDSTSHPSTKHSNGSSKSRYTGSTPSKLSSLQGPSKYNHCGGDHFSEKCFKEYGYPD